jgi:hypothetical protein
MDQVLNDNQDQVLKNNHENLMVLVEQDFSKAISQLVNEVDLLFDYVPVEVKTKLQKYSEKIKKDNAFLKTEMKTILEKLKPFEDKVYQISILKKKTKTSDLHFLDTLVLFDDTLDMKLFTNENKNTKISLVNYLSSMYMAASFGSLGFSGNFDMAELSKEMTNFMESIKQKSEITIPSSKPKRAQVRQNGMGGLQSDMGGLLSSLMSNPDIMNMATDITKDLQGENMDPLSLMSSLMSGKPNAQMDNLVSRITNKLEAKMSSGEINKDALEKQAEQIMSAVGSSDLASQVPMLQQLLQNNGGLNKK